MPLTPTKGGGVCIPDNALQPADIVVSTTRSIPSGFIRIGTLSVVSHAALVGSDGKIIEAVNEGVVIRTISEALSDDVLAVAYRHPAMTPLIAKKIVDWAKLNIGKKYNLRAR